MCREGRSATAHSLTNLSFNSGPPNLTDQRPVDCLSYCLVMVPRWMFQSRKHRAVCVCCRKRGCRKRHKVYDSLDLHTDSSHQLQLPAEGSVKVQLHCHILQQINVQ